MFNASRNKLSPEKIKFACDWLLESFVDIGMLDVLDKCDDDGDGKDRAYTFHDCGNHNKIPNYQPQRFPHLTWFWKDTK